MSNDKYKSTIDWLLEYDYKGKTWGDYGTRKKPNKRVKRKWVQSISRGSGTE